MKFKNYKSERMRLINLAEEHLNSNEFEKSSEVMAQIEELDKSFEDYKNSEEYKKDLANEKSLEDKYKITDIYNLGVNSETGTVIDSFNSYNKEVKVKNIFLNKADKLADRVVLTEENSILNSDGALGNVIRGMVTGKWTSTDLKNIVTTTTTGVLIPEVLSAKIIDLAREKSLFGAVGVPTVPMDTDNMTISRVKKDPTFAFKAEGAEATESSFELDSIQLKSKTAYGYAYISLESIKSSSNLEQVIYKVFSEAMAQCIDKAFLYGQSSDNFAPSGIINDVNINSLVATQGAGYDDIIKAIGKVKSSNGNPTALGINSQTEELFSLLKTTDGQYLTAPGSVQQLNKVVSNQLKYDEATGSDALVFDPQALLIGIQNNIQIKIIEDTECLKKGLIAFQIYAMLDCKAVTPKEICKITGIK